MGGVTHAFRDLHAEGLVAGAIGFINE